MSGTKQQDVSEIKRAAAGRWPEALTALAGIPADRLDGRNHPCPKCGGIDRFRLIDEEAGAVLCNQCFSERNGDGIAAIQHFAGTDFPAAVRMLADYLGTPANSNGRAHTTNGSAKRTPKKAADVATLTKGIKVVDHAPEIIEGFLAKYGEAKPPIKPEGVRQCGGTLVDWCGHRCIQLDGRAAIDSPTITAVVLLRIDGKPFPPFGKLTERKTHSTRDSINSWITSGDVRAAEIIFDVEGVTDLLAVVSAGLPPGWVAVTNTAGAKARGKLPREWAKGKRIIVAGDADDPGEEGKRRSAPAYHKAGASEVLYAQLPYAIEKVHGGDIRDWLNEGHTVADLPTVATKVEDFQGNGEHAGPVVVIGTDETRVIDEAEALLAPREVFQRAGYLVQVVEGTTPPAGLARTSDSPRITIVRSARIRELLADGAAWMRPNGDDKLEQVHPPDWVIKGLEARGTWPKVRPIEAVVESPVLRADGTILQTAGYDHSTAIIYRPSIDFPRIPERPSRGDALAAVQVLWEVVRDFPYASNAHRAGWFAALLTTLSRYAFPGPAPLFVFDGNVRGCGKSLQTDAIAVIGTGRSMARMTLPRDDDETRKRITAIALAGEPLVLIDNINGTLGNASLDAALTATSWSDRILGQTAMASGIPLYSTWFATGNNVVTAADTARRTVLIRLESREENPEERSDFLHANLLAWVREERPRLTAAALTILSGYCAAGRPSMKLTPWGSFEAWSDLVRNAVVWAGMPDPGGTRTALTSQSDREAAALRQLLAGWDEIDPSGAGVTIVELTRALADSPNDYDTVRGALWELSPPRDGKNLNPRSVGMKFHHLRQRVISGRYLERRDGAGGKAVWMVKTADRAESGTTGTSWTSQDSARAQAHTRTHGKPERPRNSPTTPLSPTDCQHTDIEETPTQDGYVNRQCRNCGEWLQCVKVQEART